jgi:hypothetical protein
MMLSDADLGELVRMLQAKSPLGELSNMQARVRERLASGTRCGCFIFMVVAGTIQMG